MYGQDSPSKGITHLGWEVIWGLDICPRALALS